MHPQFFMLNVFMDKTPIFFYFIKNMKRMGDDIKTFMLKINFLYARALNESQFFQPS